MARPILTLDQLKERLSYNPEDGTFTWIDSRCYSRKNGQKAGYSKTKRYVEIEIDGLSYGAHRLAWLFMTGAWPKDYVDHIDCDPSNNRFGNLREATHQQNSQNTKRPSQNNTTGFLGVSKKGLKWRSSIRIHNKLIHLGYFFTPDEAHAAYLKAKRKLHPFGTI